MDYYSIYGMNVLVSGAQGRFEAWPGSPPASLSLHLDGLPDWVESRPREPWYQSLLAGGPTMYRLACEPFYLCRFRDGCQFLFHRDGGEIWAAWPRQFDLADVTPYILGPVMGCALRFQGVSTLHASVVEIGGRAVLVTGGVGAGKSTTAAAFAKLGYRILSDDLAPLRAEHGGVAVAPGYPRICLRPPAVRLLFGSEDALPLITPGWVKRYLSLSGNGCHFCPDPLPLGAIYCISERVDSPGAPWIEDLPPSTALINLVANTYAGRLPDRTMSARDLRLYAAVVGRVPVRKAVISADPSRVLQQCQMIAANFRRGLR